MGRKKANIHYIYKTTCNVTGRWYVGMHSTCDENDGYIGSGKILRYSIRKYGVENHTKEILEYLETREELVLRETEIVNSELVGDGKCMNLKEGGTGGFSSVEHQKKASSSGAKTTNKKRWGKESKEREKNVELSRKTINETRDNFKKLGKRFGCDWTNKNHSEETKKLMSESSKGMGVGETNSQYGTCWITKDGLNKKIKKEDLESHLNNNWVRGRK